MKITAGQKGGTQEEIDVDLGKFFGRAAWDLSKILTCIALASLMIWIFIPDPWWRYLSFTPWAGSILYVLCHG